MTIFNIRRRTATDDLSPEEIENLISENAEQRNDEARDRAAEKHFEEQV